jgi:hypothetical protein
VINFSASGTEDVDGICKVAALFDLSLLKYQDRDKLAEALMANRRKVGMAFAFRQEAASNNRGPAGLI